MPSVAVVLVVHLLAFLIASDLIHAIPVGSNSINIHSRDRKRASQDQRCGFAGTNDVYGLGIRIGYYTQALSIWFANYFVLGEAKILRSVNLLFLVAAFIGLIRLSHQSSSVYAIEVFLLLQLVIATWYTGVLDRGSFSKKYWRFSPMRSIVTSVTMMSVLGYNAWFWWTGLENMKKTPCGTFVFFMAKVELFGWYREMYKVLAIPAVIFGAVTEIGRSLELFLLFKSRHEDKVGLYRRLRSSFDAELSGNLSNAPISSVVNASAVIPHGQNGELSKSESDSRDKGPDCSSTRVSPRFIELETAIQVPLPPSPDKSQRSPNPSDSTTQQTSMAESASTSNTPILSELFEAEQFVSDILATSVKKHSTWHYDLHLPFSKAPLRIFIWSFHSPRTLYRRWSTISFQRPYNFAILLPLFQHVKSISRYPFYSYLPMFEKAMTSPQYKTVSPLALHAILDFHTAQMPNNKFVWTIVWQALFSLCVVAGLILSIELAVRWNSITEIASVGDVGQLIPAVIGVGGLLRVIWAWVSRSDLAAVEEDGVEKEVRECAEMYDTVKSAIGSGQVWQVRVPDYT